MNFYYQIPLSLLLLISSLNSNASKLSEDAQSRGINETCSSYLNQIEESYNLSGLNLTFVNPENPSSSPSLHVSSQKYNNGSSSFSATLTPDEERCYLSSILVTSINNQSCSEIEQIKLENDPTLKAASYLEGQYTVITPENNSYQIILTSSGKESCTITDARMMWPG